MNIPKKKKNEFIAYIYIFTIKIYTIKIILI